MTFRGRWLLQIVLRTADTYDKGDNVSVPDSTDSPPPTRSLSILVVDDDPVVLKTVELLLSLEGHSARSVPGGCEAIDLLQQQSYDLVISDVRMPRMDGIQLSRKIRTAYPSTPIILMTGHIAEYSLGTASEIGINCILHKPFRADELRDAVQQAIAS